MAFVAGSEGGGQNKQHLNLSALAYEVVVNDMFAFREDSLSGFINRVFENYRAEAEASIAQTLNRFRGELDRCVAEVPGDEQTKKRMIERLLGVRRDELLRQAESYPSEKSFKFWLNKGNLDYLSEEWSECNEDKYYSRRGRYIKAVLEEYARLPYVKRELVYFNSSTTEIQSAIQESRRLRIVTDKGMVYSVYPREILSDPLSMANYLVGYGVRYDHPETELRPCSFRISVLQSVRMERSKSAYLKKDMWKQLAQEIEAKGVQFLAGDVAEIQVRLTEEGVRKYKRQAHLRPACVRREGDVYTCKCTTAQAEFYFFKFGKDAEIISPTYLRGWFGAMYESAAVTYRDKKEE